MLRRGECVNILPGLFKKVCNNTVNKLKMNILDSVYYCKNRLFLSILLVAWFNIPTTGESPLTKPLCPLMSIETRSATPPPFLK